MSNKPRLAGMRIPPRPAQHRQAAASVSEPSASSHPSTSSQEAKPVAPSSAPSVPGVPQEPPGSVASSEPAATHALDRMGVTQSADRSTQRLSLVWDVYSSRSSTLELVLSRHASPDEVIAGLRALAEEVEQTYA